MTWGGRQIRGGSHYFLGIPVLGGALFFRYSYVYYLTCDRIYGDLWGFISPESLISINPHKSKHGFIVNEPGENKSP